MAGYGPTDASRDKPNLLALMLPLDRAAEPCCCDAQRPTQERPWFLEPGGLTPDALAARRGAVLAVLGAAPRLLEVLRAASGNAALTPAEAQLAGELGGWIVRLEAEASVLGFGESGA